MKSKKNIAILGIGRWGKNLLREFSKVVNISYVYHRNSAENSKWLDKNYPNIKTAVSYAQILHDPSVEAVVIATPISTHYELAREALKSGKHIFVEKPITNNAKQAQELVKLAIKKKRILFVGHIFSYHPILARIKSLTHREPIKHASFVWNKLGTFNEELIFNLASHDIATALDLFGKPTNIKTLEKSGLVTNSDLIYVKLGFSKHRSCTIYINRLSSLKNKTVTLITTKNIYLWENDLLSKLDKKANIFKLIYTSIKTPLEIECAEFIKCLRQKRGAHTDGKFGLEVVKVLARI